MGIISIAHDKFGALHRDMLDKFGGYILPFVKFFLEKIGLFFFWDFWIFLLFSFFDFSVPSAQTIGELHDDCEFGIIET